MIAYDCGSVPEVMEDGVSGFIVREIDEAPEAVDRARNPSRAGCREVFEKRFTAGRMAKDYVNVYEQMSRRDAIGVPVSELMAYA